MTHPLRLILVIAALVAAPVAAQTASERADSLVRLRDGLFDSTSAWPSSLEPRVSPSSWHPDFAARFRRHDLLGLADRPFTITYDRADGIALRAGSDRPMVLGDDGRARAHLTLGYAIGSHYWQASAGYSHDLFDTAAPLRVSIEGHVVTDTRDAWKVDALENSMLALVAGVDARDYFRRRGASISLTQYLGARTSVSVAGRVDDHRSARRESEWSIFGPAQPFRAVAPVRDGVLGSIAFGFAADLSSLRAASDPRLGIAIEIELGGLRLPRPLPATPFGRFTAMTADGRVVWSAAPRLLRLGARARLAVMTGDVPPQRLVTIGGLGTVSGYPQNEQAGTTMTLVQTELLLTPFARGILGDVGLLVTGEAARIDAWLYSPGIHLATRNGRLRVGAAWRTDVAAPPRLVIRFAEAF